MSTNSSGEFIGLYNLWRHDGKTPLTSIQGFSDLLLKGVVGDLNEQQRHFLEIILRNCAVAVSSWDDPAAYLELRYQMPEMEWQAIDLRVTVEEALRSVAPQAVAVTMPAVLPPVRSNEWLQRALQYLLRLDRPEGAAGELPLRLSVVCQEERVRVEVYYPGLMMVKEGCWGADRFRPGSRLSLVNLILERLECLLVLETQPEGMGFTFNLPLWPATE